MRLGALLAGLVLLVACGDSATDTADGGGGDTGGSGAQGGSGPGGGGSGAGGATTEYVGFGSVVAASLSPATGPTSSVSAGFTMLQQGDENPCTTIEDGDCLVIECSTDPLTVIRRSAGAVTVTGGSREVTLTPDASNEYAASSSATEGLFDGGETVRVAAAGDHVPAFEVSATAPSAITFSAPNFFAPITVDRTQDLEVTWTGGADGVAVAVVATVGADRTVDVVCEFPASAGSGSIPAAVLGQLPDPSEITSAAVSGGVRSQEQVETGDWLVTLTLVGSGLKDDGTSAYAQAVLQ